MRATRFVCFISICLAALIGNLSAQESTTQPATAVKDPQALSIINQSLAAVGGAAAIEAIQDYTGTGTVSYYWGDGEQGSVTVKGKGTGDFRVDAVLPEGSRTWAVSNGAGFVSDADGDTKSTPYQNAINLGSLTLPYLFLANTLQDPSSDIAYIGLESHNGVQVEHVQTHEVTSPDYNGMFASLTKRDFYFDSGSSRLLFERDSTHPSNSATVDYPREVRFSDYQQVSGVWAPFLIEEFVNNQPTETIQLDQLSFNSGLQETAFEQQ
ncbi:MAG TPA: hypothetical protein VMB47_12100 [Candidatus Aquilonibacter sp.]|nr:hypothetical protein [Candidatus Aquilonibacter sp.]